MSSSGIDVRRLVTQNLGLLLPAVIVGAVVVLIAPLSPFVLDLLISANIAVAVVMLLTTIQVRRPTDFHVFPSLLLATTLTRLVLNVASTRLILSEAGTKGAEAAGGVIGTFGNFVAGGSPAVGLVMFVVLVAIQFLVITKGATRISEVAARFALEGMTGRLSAIDADLQSGRIEGQEAQRRREEVSQQADFYGAMDGAGKFVRGDAIAGLLITAINLIGGLAIGVFGQGMPVDEAISVFSTLTIGDGLVSQLPAILISLAAGFLVTQSSSNSTLSRDVVTQMTGQSTPLLVASLLLAGLALTGLPMIPLLSLAGVCGALGMMVSGSTPTQESQARNAGSTNTNMTPTERTTHRTASTSHGTTSHSNNATSAHSHSQQPSQETSPSRPTAAASPRMEQALSIEPLALELGVSLVRLADRQSGGDLLDRVAEMRDRIAGDLGFIVPKLLVRDNLRLDPRQFRVLLRGVSVATGTLYADALLAVNDGRATETLSGIETIEPKTGKPAYWIEPGQAAQAQLAGYRNVSAVNVLMQSLDIVVRAHGCSLLTRTQVHELLNHLRSQAPLLVEELIPSRLTATELHRVLASLLAEQVSIRDLETIIEALSDAVLWEQRDLRTLTEVVRIRLGRTIIAPLCDDEGELHVLEMNLDRSQIEEKQESRWSDRIQSQFQDQLEEEATTTDWVNTLLSGLDDLRKAGHPAVVLCDASVRPDVQHQLSLHRNDVTVLSHREIPRRTKLRVYESVNPVPQQLHDGLPGPSAHEFDRLESPSYEAAST
ncbi:MAG: flagellar biosynthesis protein FlhA [Planctomycetaceae bacterium]